MFSIVSAKKHQLVQIHKKICLLLLKFTPRSLKDW